jgi:hypothetical protein
VSEGALLSLYLEAGRAIHLAREATDEAESTDRGHTPPEIAAHHERAASAALRRVSVQFAERALDYQTAAVIHERAQETENTTGREWRGPKDAA